MARKTKPADQSDDQMAGAAAEAATGLNAAPVAATETPATGTGGAAEAGEAVAAAAPAEAPIVDPAPVAEIEPETPEVQGGPVVQLTDAPFDRAGWPAEIVIKGPEKGRWRAGRLFGPQPVPVPLAEVTDEQLLALRGDPELTLIGWQ
jgi:hypothetical protein